MKKIAVFGAMVSLSLFLACNSGKNENAPADENLKALVTSRSPNQTIEHFILPESTDFNKIPQSTANPLTSEKIELGKMLFFESGFGVEAKRPDGMQTFSCSSCHVPEAGFRPNRVQGIADGAYGFGIMGERRFKHPAYYDNDVDAQGARPLATLNTAYVTNSMWNGSFGHSNMNEGTEQLWGVFDPGTAINAEKLGSLEGQNIEGLKTHRLLYNDYLIEKLGYKQYFDAAFANVPVAERYNRKTASFAISAYLRALLTNQAPFQKWLKGDNAAMTEAQKRGAMLFFDKANCYKCHYETNLGSISFRAIGVKDLFENGGIKTSLEDRRNLGRGGFTGRQDDMYKFRVPQLYNLGDSGPYFHGSSKTTLEEVIEYFDKAEPENLRVPTTQISPDFKPLYLSAQEKADLVEFVRNGLRDPNLLRYVPSKVLSGNCFPNNDSQSRNDLGCKK